MALGGVGQFPQRGDENDPRRGRRKAIIRQEPILSRSEEAAKLAREEEYLQDEVKKRIKESTNVRRIPPDIVTTDEYSSATEVPQGDPKDLRPRTRNQGGLKGLIEGRPLGVEKLNLIDTNMTKGRIPSNYYQQTEIDKVTGEEIPLEVAIRNPGVERRTDLKTASDIGNTRQNEIKRSQLKRGGEVDPIYETLADDRSYGISKSAGSLEDESKANYINSQRDPAEIKDGDINPLNLVQTRSRKKGWIPKEIAIRGESGGISGVDMNVVDKEMPKNPGIDPTIRIDAFGEGDMEQGERLGKVASQILREAKTELIEFDSPDLRLLKPEEQLAYIQQKGYNPKSKEAQNLIGIVIRPKTVNVQGVGTRTTQEVLPVFNWNGAEYQGKYRIGNPMSRDVEYLRSQAHRLGLVPTTQKSPIKKKKQTISMGDIRKVQQQGYTFKRLDDRGARAEMIRPDGTKTLLNLLPDGSGYRIADSYRTYDTGITQLLNQPDDAYARFIGEKATGVNTIDFYHQLAGGSFMEEPSDGSRAAMDNIADAVMTGKLKTAKGVVDIDPQEILKRFKPGSAALQDLESAIRAKSAKSRELDIIGETSLTNKNKAARELYENLSDYKVKMGAAMPVDLGRELIMAIGKKYQIDPTEVATSLREAPLAVSATEEGGRTEVQSEERERKTRRRSSAEDASTDFSEAMANQMTIKDPNKTRKAELESGWNLSRGVDTRRVLDTKENPIIPAGSNADKYWVEKGYRRGLGVPLEEGNAEANRLRRAYQIDQESSNIPQTSSINTANASQVNAPEKPLTPTDYKRAEEAQRVANYQRVAAETEAVGARNTLLEGLGTLDKDVGSPEYDKAMNDIMQRLLRRRR